MYNLFVVSTPSTFDGIDQFLSLGVVPRKVFVYTCVQATVRCCVDPVLGDLALELILSYFSLFYELLHALEFLCDDGCVAGLHTIVDYAHSFGLEDLLMLAVHVVTLYARNDKAIVLMSHQGLAETWLGSWSTYLAYHRSDGFPHL